MMRALLTFALALAVVLGSAVAAAQGSEADKAAARELAIDAQKAFAAGDYESALTKFDKAEQLFHAPTLLVGMARAYVKLGKYVEAMESYNRVVREKLPEHASDAFTTAVEDAKRELVGLDTQIGWVTIRVTGPQQPQVTLDGDELRAASLGVKRPANPGDHQVKASGAGFKPAESSFTLGAGETKELALALEADPDAIGRGGTPGGDTGTTGGTLRTIGWVAVGVGGAGLIVGAVTGGLAMGKHDELANACTDGRCPPDQQDNLNSYRTIGLVSTAGFIAGGVLAATGVVLLVAAPSDAASNDVAPSDAAKQARSRAAARLAAGPASVQLTVPF